MTKFGRFTVFTLMGLVLLVINLLSSGFVLAALSTGYQKEDIPPLFPDILVMGALVEILICLVLCVFVVAYSNDIKNYEQSMGVKPSRLRNAFAFVFSVVGGSFALKCGLTILGGMLVLVVLEPNYVRTWKVPGTLIFAALGVVWIIKVLGSIHVLTLFSRNYLGSNIKGLIAAYWKSGGRDHHKT